MQSWFREAALSPGLPLSITPELGPVLLSLEIYYRRSIATAVQLLSPSNYYRRSIAVDFFIAVAGDLLPLL